jgi:hypothetical protein
MREWIGLVHAWISSCLVVSARMAGSVSGRVVCVHRLVARVCCLAACV